MYNDDVEALEAIISAVAEERAKCDARCLAFGRKVQEACAKIAGRREPDDLRGFGSRPDMRGEEKAHEMRQLDLHALLHSDNENQSEGSR